MLPDGAERRSQIVECVSLADATADVTEDAEPFQGYPDGFFVVAHPPQNHSDSEQRVGFAIRAADRLDDGQSRFGQAESLLVFAGLLVDSTFLNQRGRFTASITEVLIAAKSFIKQRSSFGKFAGEALGTAKICHGIGFTAVIRIAAVYRQGSFQGDYGRVVLRRLPLHFAEYPQCVRLPQPVPVLIEP